MTISIIALLIVLVFVIVKRSELIAFAGKRTYSKTRDVDKALKWFSVANRIGTLSTESLRYYGWLLMRGGQFDLARNILNLGSMTAKKPASKNRIKAMLAVAEWKGGDLDLAIEMSEDVLSEHKETVVFENLGLFYNIKGDGKKALEFNKIAFDYNPDSMGIVENLAKSYMLCGETEKAVELYEELLEKEPHFPDPYYTYGQILVDKGEYERGIELIEKALEKSFSCLSVLQKSDVEKILEDAKAKR